MITESIKKIETQINNSNCLADEKKTELMELLSNLKDEINQLPTDKHNESIESMAGFMEISAREATRKEKNPQLTDLAIEGLASSSREFETSHPNLTNYVNRICDMLSNIGI
jgi:hypothetical protein